MTAPRRARPGRMRVLVLATAFAAVMGAKALPAKLEAGFAERSAPRQRAGVVPRLHQNRTDLGETLAAGGRLSRAAPEAGPPPLVFAEARKRPPRPKPPQPVPAAPPAVTAAPRTEPAAPEPSPPPPERLEIDASTHSVFVPSVFKGTEIVVFGTVINGRQESPEAGYYDVVVTVEGRPTPALVRSKARIGGVWANTRAIRFDGLPIYLAIAATRPLNEIADPPVLAIHAIGFPRARMFPVSGATGLDNETIDAFKTAFLRLKEKDGLYVHDDFGVGFIGRSLFRSSIRLPANIPVGPLTARTFLFRDGELLAAETSHVVLRRSGVDVLIYDFAFDHPVLYGLLAALVACAASLASSYLMRRWRA